MYDFFDFSFFLVRYRIGESRSTHELRFLSDNIVSARQEVIERHRNGKLYPPLSAYLPLKIVSIVEC